MSYFYLSEARQAFGWRHDGMPVLLDKVPTWHNVYVMKSPSGKAAVATYGMARIKRKHAVDLATKSLLSYRIRVIPK